jgi:hypothetical protein
LIVRTSGGGTREFRMPSPYAQDYIPSPSAEFGPWAQDVTGGSDFLWISPGRPMTPRMAIGVPPS